MVPSLWICPASEGSTVCGLLQSQGLSFVWDTESFNDPIRVRFSLCVLCRWEWAEHARWFPHCGYVLLVKGQQFVDSCRVRVSILEQSELSLVWLLCRWEWAEHARWFPHCGYVLLVKGKQFVDSCRVRVPTESRAAPRRSNANSTVTFPVSESQVADCMESEAAMAALGAGLDAARVRRAIVRRLRSTGMVFNSSEALIDAVLDEQLNEEAWSVSPRSQRLARDILAETLRQFAPTTRLTPSSQDESSDGRASPPDSPTQSSTPEAYLTIREQRRRSPRRSRTPSESRTSPNSSRTDQNSSRTDQNSSRSDENAPDSSTSESRTDCDGQEAPVMKKLTLEEENRQLKEARLCKVCMDSEVSVVFLPCGHLVSCGGCGAALAACPLCRAPVKALVRAYLA
ncbi:zinc finger, c3HC4 type (RING finger) domain-containing protein [Phthorimaea operculella]|nr:zinc finger, c3HC4 type (RING finger) domain-containing protein [Phthorimaea operculella]